MIHVGDCREVLRSLPACSVQTVVTSPPYFGLRDYGTGEWEGGDPGCDHSPEKRGGRFATPVSAKQASNAGSGTASARNCPCGATRTDRQIGLEPTPDMFVAAMVSVFREVRRVLRDDGTVWLNLGDSYNSAASNQQHDAETSRLESRAPNSGLGRRSLVEGCKPKDLQMIPAQVALALRADGWYLRSDIIWNKPNPMPESVTDRPTSAHEHLFLLSKGPRYFYDADAIREPALQPVGEPQKTGDQSKGESMTGRGESTGGYLGSNQGLPWRNKRNVWTVATQPYSEAHFATFPPKLIEPCILAGSAPGDVVLDPFAGAGTTGVVCGWHGRQFVGVELNPEYAQMAERRIALEGRPGGKPNGHETADVIPGQESLFG